MVILSVIIQRLSEPILIKSSYLIYLTTHKSELTEVNEILLTKTGEISVLGDSVIDRSNKLTTFEKAKLSKLRRHLHVYMISKSDEGVYYGLWGFLDVQIGLTYWTDLRKPDNHYRILTEDWYY